MTTRFTLVGVLLLLTFGFASAQYCPEPSTATSTFNWMADSWWVWIRPSGTQAAVYLEVPSPYHPNVATSQPNTNHLHKASGFGDYRLEDGWVLIKEEMGLTIPIRWPQFVLYNRFESKLRYFAYLTDIDGVDQIEIKTQFIRSIDFTHVTAALEHAFTPMDVVENYQDKRIILKAPNEFYGQSGIWVMADIPIAYDPCTCQNSSLLEIVNNSVNYMSLNFSLTGGGDITQVIEGGSVKNDGNRFANVVGGVTNGISKGNSAYKTAGELISVADKLLVGSTNRRLTQDARNTLATLGYLALGDDLTSSDIQSLYNIWDQGPANHPLRPLINELIPQKVSSVVPDWIKTAVPFANTAFALLDFIIGGGKSTSPQPMHFQADFKFEGNGEITDESYRVSLAFRVPGSKSPQNSAPVYSPLYDKTLGILNVVEQPVMYLSEGNQQTVSSIYDPYLNTLKEELKWDNSLKLSSALKYALNPASELQIADIRASIYFMDCNGTSIPGLITDEPGVLRTPYMPLSCLENYSLNSFFRSESRITNNVTSQNPEEQVYNNGYSPCSVSDIQLHLMAKLTSPAGKETAWAARYRVNTAPAPYTYENTPANPYLNVQESVEVPSIQDLINGNIQSWNPVVVTNDIVVTRGEVENYLNSANAVKDHQDILVQQFVRGQVIKAPVKFDLAPNCGTLPPVDAAWLSSFCTTPNRYNPILALRTPSEEEEAPVAENKLNLSIAPNPTGDATLLKYNLIEAGPVQIVLSDYTGRQLAELHTASEQAAGEYQLHIPLERYAPGIYVVTVTRPSGKDSVRVVKH